MEDFYGAQQKKKSDQVYLICRSRSHRDCRILIFYRQFGVSQADIEADARESQKIDESWLCVKASEDDVTAMLFYDEFLGDYKVSIYTNPADRPFGSFFLYGGTTNAENEGIAEYLISDSGDRVYMSMNLQNADFNENAPQARR